MNTFNLGAFRKLLRLSDNEAIAGLNLSKSAQVYLIGTEDWPTLEEAPEKPQSAFEVVAFILSHYRAQQSDALKAKSDCIWNDRPWVITDRGSLTRPNSLTDDDTYIRSQAAVDDTPMLVVLDSEGTPLARIQYNASLGTLSEEHAATLQFYTADDKWVNVLGNKKELPRTITGLDPRMGSTEPDADGLRK